jgi:hypothetical protein
MAPLREVLEKKITAYGSMSIALAAAAFAPPAEASLILTTLSPELTTPENGYVFFNLKTGAAGIASIEPAASNPGSFFLSNLKLGQGQKAKFFGFGSTVLSLCRSANHSLLQLPSWVPGRRSAASCNSPS